VAGSAPYRLCHAPLDPGTKIELRLPVLVAEDYLPDVRRRFLLYKRIASAPDDAALTLLEEEMVCCFVPLPPPAKDLLRVTRIELPRHSG